MEGQIVTRQFSPEELKTLSDGFENKPAQEVLNWALTQFHQDIALACSFGAPDMVLVDMVVKINPEAKIFYLDTDVLFPETYALIRRVSAHYGITPLRYQACLSLDEQAQAYGDKLWEREPDVCCNIRKVRPLVNALKTLRAWITGIRREETPARRTSGIVEWDQKFGLVKFNPLAQWTMEEVWDYIKTHDVPYNPLHEQGYPSIGCTHCTSQVKPGEDPRSGRWRGFQKDECGLHCGTDCVILTATPENTTNNNAPPNPPQAD